MGKKQQHKIERLNEYLLKVTTFQIIGKEELKEELKKEVCKLIDEKFAYIEKDIKEANIIIGDLLI